MHSCIVACGNSGPVAVFLVGGLQILACRNGRFLGIVALVHLVPYFEAIIAACSCQQLPHASGLGAGIGIVVHRALGNSQVQEIKRDTLLLENLGKRGEIAVGALETQFGRRLAVNDACQFTVQALSHVQTVKAHFFPGKRHACRDVWASRCAEYGRRC